MFRRTACRVPDCFLETALNLDSSTRSTIDIPALLAGLPTRIAEIPVLAAARDPQHVALIEQSNKEISTRFDFKGSDARVEQKESEITAYADDDFKLGQVKDVLLSKMAKRNVDVRFLDYGKIEKIGGDKVKQVIKIKKGVSGDLSKKIVRLVKDSKIKVQASIQGDAVRITGGKRDDLHSVIAMLRKDVTDTPLDFNNFRD